MHEWAQSVVSEGRAMCWAITVFDTDCSGEYLSIRGCTINGLIHLVVDMNARAMVPRGAAVVGAMRWTQGKGSMLSV